VLLFDFGGSDCGALRVFSFGVVPAGHGRWKLLEGQPEPPGATPEPPDPMEFLHFPFEATRTNKLPTSNVLAPPVWDISLGPNGRRVDGVV
jgi:hypothetical protein